MSITNIPNALLYRVAAKMGSFNIDGLMHDAVNPMIVKSLTDSSSDLLDLEFELKPLDKSCDQSVRLIARPTEIVYDAVSVFTQHVTCSLSLLFMSSCWCMLIVFLDDYQSCC